MPTCGVCRQIEVTGLEGAACLCVSNSQPDMTAMAVRATVLTEDGCHHVALWLWSLPVLPSALNLEDQAQRRRALGT